MTAKTKAQLAKRVSELQEANAALRGLLEAVRDTATVPRASVGQFEDYKRLLDQRFTSIRVWLAGVDFTDVQEVSRKADLFNSDREPVLYRAVCHEQIRGTSAHQTCELDLGHDGECSPEAPAKDPGRSGSGARSEADGNSMDVCS